MKLFDDFDRVDTSSAAYGEDHFAYRNPSARPKFAAGREAIEGWFSRYPEREQAGLRARVRDKNAPNSFESAFFDLFLHDLFASQGCRGEVHPESTGSTKRPDFYITTPGGGSLVLEAIVATAVSEKDRAEESRLNAFLNAVNQVESPNFFIHVSYGRFVPSTPVPVSRVRSQVQGCIDGLDYDRVRAAYESGSPVGPPSYTFRHEGSWARLEATPKIDCRGRPGVAPIGSRIGGAVWDRTHQDITAAVKSKPASEYGVRGLPYVVAVRCMGPRPSRGDIEGALYGRRRGSAKDLEALAIADREDGVWAGKHGKRTKSTGAVLIVSELYPWALRVARVCLYHNPWAVTPVAAEGLRLTVARFTPEGVKYCETPS
jgi:hypothetical protein